MVNPYQGRPDKSFWRKACAADHVTKMTGLFGGVPGLRDMKVATAGSCFAQHVGRAIKARGLQYMDYEPPPPFLSAHDADRLGYGVYSCRYGNIYTVAQLRQLQQEVLGERTPEDAVWVRDGHVFDALRPGMEPDGFGSIEELRTLRRRHLERVQKLFLDLDLFVFTLGLTEAWVSKADGTVYPSAPGVIAGEFDPERYLFRNYRYPEIYSELREFIDCLRSMNPKAQVLLTVSPVPLAATATNEHVLSATTYSKSVLRSVAGDIAADVPGTYYFPSYEVITGQPSRHMYYNPDLRTVAQAGVDNVMQHFFAGEQGFKRVRAEPQPDTALGFEHCEEGLLGQSAS